jgi:hypothetical protein
MLFIELDLINGGGKAAIHLGAIHGLVDTEGGTRVLLAGGQEVSVSDPREHIMRALQNGLQQLQAAQAQAQTRSRLLGGLG